MVEQELVEFQWLAKMMLVGLVTKTDLLRYHKLYDADNF